MNLTVFRTGYVGLGSESYFSEIGNTVTCIINVDIEKIENMKKGVVPIYEAVLKAVVLRNLENKTTRLGKNIFD